MHSTPERFRETKLLLTITILSTQLDSGISLSVSYIVTGAESVSPIMEKVGRRR